MATETLRADTQYSGERGEGIHDVRWKLLATRKVNAMSLHTEFPDIKFAKRYSFRVTEALH